jgi:glycine dehydrogenase subunit 2
MSDAKLIFDKGRPGRRGSTVPALDVPLADGLGNGPRRENPAEMPEVTELEVVRHFTNLSRKNMAIDTNYYPLGSCTMKYNPKFHEQVAAMPGFAGLHPLLPQLRGGGALTQGALGVLYEMEQWLCELLGFSAFTMQPLAGAHGELTGIMLIAAYHKKRNDGKRTVMLIPDAAHGTNPATAAMCGFDVRELATDDQGNVCMQSLKEALAEPDTVAGLMLTCPSTLGLFDQNVEEITRLVHEAGGLCYCDGANLNAIIGRVRPGDVGFDVMHVNLHKTFSTPHGGGGPGSGVVGVAPVLEPFLPVSRVEKSDDGTYGLKYDYEDTIGYIAAFYGNFGMVLRAYAYAMTLGREGLKRVGENSVINANYLRVKLQDHIAPAYDRACMHECVLSATKQKAAGFSALDIAKALLDKGFHPPTMYFPLVVPEALMIEPTETESKETLDEFIQAVIEVLEAGYADPDSLHDAPKNFPVTRLDETRAARKPVVASL